jgi:methyl-accepting chemotaxis protein
MKNKFKLNVIAIAFVLIVAGCIALIVLQQSANATLAIARQKTMYMAHEYAREMDGKINSYIQVLQTLSNIMNFYESIEPDIRRQTYEKTIQSVFEDMPEFVRMFTVWKPDAIDGMDAVNIARAGSTFTGQFAFTLTRETGQIVPMTSDVVQEAMAHLTGPNSESVEMVDPVVINLSGKDTWCLKIMVPILNKRINESVAVICCQFSIDMIQSMIMQTIKDNDEISSMAIYTNTGFILANYLPELIGKQLIEVETKYGSYINEVAETVKNAQEYECSSYNSDMKTNMVMALAPIHLADSPTKWALMVGSTEKYILRKVSKFKQIVIILMAITIVVVVVIKYFALNRTNKQRR